MDDREVSSHFIRTKIIKDLENKKFEVVETRFPPEPNGCLHIGHAKSICLNFGMADEFKGKCHLRFDDTNPVKEDMAYVEAIKKDVKWLGFEWGERISFASDFYDDFYNIAIDLIKKGRAYVCDLNHDEIRKYRGTLTEPGKDSPYRTRTVEENLDLFEKMKNGDFEEGSKVLRLKIDMSSPNFCLRDPAVYRIMKMPHYRTGDKWKIYPMYDFSQCISDALNGVTHSLCTLEFENNRPLYEWILSNADIKGRNGVPEQTEFARLNLSFTVLSKRKLIELVNKNIVNGWDDPRMPTITGMKRRGIPPGAIREFCDKIGVAKKDSIVDFALFEHCIRDELNASAPRRFGVLNPLKVVIENYDDEKEELVECKNHPSDESMGSREVPFSKIIYIEKDDFMENPPKKFFRLGPGREVRLRYAYFIKCHDYIKDENGELVELRCTYDPATKGGNAPDGRKVKGTIHWVSQKHAVKSEVRIYDRLFNVENPGKGNLEESLNADSLKIIENCMLEPDLKNADYEQRFQFERSGYFTMDKDSKPDYPVFNRIVSLRDQWAKIAKK
ncbi:MAG: glutamine--tRNA ligase [Deltaproteobacteria bacterium]|nr:MAG: glutamine--tRNA ligase [Deltaproteobacteria bacterium]PIE74926.1 MAG: glutamine--tRNA ligase [Deltaproteobacteria bacterium]